MLAIYAGSCWCCYDTGRLKGETAAYREVRNVLYGTVR
jgi:hypothetical protein